MACTSLSTMNYCCYMKINHCRMEITSIKWISSESRTPKIVFDSPFLARNPTFAPPRPSPFCFNQAQQAFRNEMTITGWWWYTALYVARGKIPIPPKQMQIKSDVFAERFCEILEWLRVGKKVAARHRRSLLAKRSAPSLAAASHLWGIKCCCY